MMNTLQPIMNTLPPIYAYCTKVLSGKQTWRPYCCLLLFATQKDTEPPTNVGVRGERYSLGQSELMKGVHGPLNLLLQNIACLQDGCKSDLVAIGLR